MPTYGEVRTKFKSRLNRRDCTDALADGFLADAIKRIQRVIRVPAGEKSVEVTVDDVTYDGRLPIPSDYIQLKDITITHGSGKRTVLKKTSLDVVQKAIDWGVEGSSRIFARQGGSWIIGPSPLENDVIRIDYYSEYESTEAAADESILLDIADDLVIFGALSYACDHWHDKRGPNFEGRFTQILSDIEAQGDDDELAGNPEVSMAFEFPDDIQ